MRRRSGLDSHFCPAGYHYSVLTPDGCLLAPDQDMQLARRHVSKLTIYATAMAVN